jgi:hypothetical protein
VIISNGRVSAASAAPTIMHSSQPGKFAPAMVTMGSQAANVRMTKMLTAEINANLIEDRFFTEMLYADQSTVTNRMPIADDSEETRCEPETVNGESSKPGESTEEAATNLESSISGLRRLSFGGKE